MKVRDLNIIDCMRDGFDDYIEDGILLHICYDMYTDMYLISVTIFDDSEDYDRHNSVLLSFKDMFKYRHEFHRLINSLIFYAY